MRPVIGNVIPTSLAELFSVVTSIEASEVRRSIVSAFHFRLSKPKFTSC